MQEPVQPSIAPPRLSLLRRLVRYPFFFTILSMFLFFSCLSSCVLLKYLFGIEQPTGAEGTAQVAERIAEWTLPDDFEGKHAVTIDNFAMQFDLAIYKHKQGRGALVVAQMHWKSEPPKNVPDFAQQFIDLFAQELKRLDLSETEKKTFTIRESPAEFEIGRGEDRATVTKYRQVTGKFRGKAGDASLILQAEDGYLSDEQIEQFLKSIK